MAAFTTTARSRQQPGDRHPVAAEPVLSATRDSLPTGQRSSARKLRRRLQAALDARKAAQKRNPSRQAASSRLRANSSTRALGRSADAGSYKLGSGSGRFPACLPQITPSHDNQIKGRADKKPDDGDVDRDPESEFERRARKRNRSMAAWDSVGRSSQTPAPRQARCTATDSEPLPVAAAVPATSRPRKQNRT
jgi:hypothetical protein